MLGLKINHVSKGGPGGQWLDPLSLLVRKIFCVVYWHIEYLLTYVCTVYFGKQVYQGLCLRKVKRHSLIKLHKFSLAELEGDIFHYLVWHVIFTRSQFLAFKYCRCVCPCVCVCQPRACPGSGRPWPSRSNLALKSQNVTMSSFTTGVNTSLVVPLE